MKVFVGTMESGEADFPQCVRAIKEQDHKHVTHVVISGMTESLAHQRLYATWEEVKADHELFLKVDADTVLAHEHVISDIVRLFQEQPRLTGMQAWLYDHMTAGNIFGLGCTRNTVAFTKAADPLYPDRVDLNHDLVMRGDSLPSSLNPAGYHCRYANDLQAFHFGVHRMLKGQRAVINRVHAAWMKDRDRVRAMVLIGCGLSHRFTTGHKFNYADDDFKRVFEEATQRYDEFVNDLVTGKQDRIK